MPACEWVTAGKASSLSPSPTTTTSPLTRLNTKRERGPPPRRTVLIEQSGMPSLNKDIGETIVIERPDGKKQTLRIAGVTHDLTHWPTTFLGNYYGYVTFDTMEWFGEPRTYNEMLIRVETNQHDKEHIEQVAREVYDKIQKSGRDPSFPKVPTPGAHPLDFLITALIALMGLMGVFALVLSGFLVTNTISALLAQQIKQIGMMKAVGARPTQIMVIYFVLVICFGLIALAPAVPLAQLASVEFAGYLASFLNFEINDPSMPLYVPLVQAIVSLVVPLVASLIPIRSGTHITIREALASEGVATSYGKGMLDRFIQRVRGLPRPVLLSLRNSFRRKGRVILTLTTLSLGGAFFISVFSIHGSLKQTLEEMVTSLYNYDIEVYLNRAYRADNLINEATQVEGVVDAECLAQSKVRRIYPDDSESLDINLFAVPPDTQTMHPEILQGRWLLPNDENALVVSTGVLKHDPDMQPGKEVVLDVKDREKTWVVVGVARAMGEARWAFASYTYYTRAAREVGQSSYLRVVAHEHTAAAQERAANALEQHFKRQSIDVSSSRTLEELSQGDREAIEVITFSLMFVAILVAVVGGLGLAGTMSLNVIERVREIGIMRAIGASDIAVLQVFIVEGVAISLISWCIGGVLSIPIGILLSNALGNMLFSSPLTFEFSFSGIVTWLIFSLVIAVVASFLPAWRATRVSVRDVLSHE